VVKLALASAPLARAFAAKTIDSKFGGVQIGAITYSFNRIAAPDPEAIIRAYAEIGLGEAELMSNHCESLAGAPAMPAFGRGPGGGGRAQAAPPAPGGGAPPAAAQGGERRGGGGGGRFQLTPEQQEERRAAMAKLAEWRKSTGPDTWKKVTQKFNDAGVDVQLLCYNMQDSMTDDDIEYGFTMAEGLGVKGITTSTTLTMAKRIAPVADKHKLLVGYHGHDATNDPNQTATLESYDTLMAYGKFNGVNLDIGHFTAAGYDAIPFLERYHDRTVTIHIKDRTKNRGPNVVWGTGDTPLAKTLVLLKQRQWKIPANIEYAYKGGDTVAEVRKCYEFAKNVLA